VVRLGVQMFLTKNCVNCNKEYLAKPTNKLYCSNKCRGHHYATVKYADHRRMVARRNIHKRFSRNCDYCGKFYVGSGKCYCSKECWILHLPITTLGKNNPAWEGGLSYLPYPISFDNILKERIRDRDLHKCQLCGAPEMECETRLCIHHIDYDKSNGADNNLISLCKLCHIKTNTHRKHWKEYFMNKMGVANASL